jgi:uncharacterized protein
MRDKLLNDLTSAMKSQDKETLSVLRMVKGAMQLEEINKKRPLNDEEMLSVLTKQIKTRKESVVEFEKANRVDLKEKTEAEISILDKYMPVLMSEEEINDIVLKCINEVNPSSTEIGKLMGAVTPLVKGKADMSLVSKIVKDKLSQI